MTPRITITPDPAAPHVVTYTHRYGWFGQEIGTIAFLLLAPSAVLAAAHAWAAWPVSVACAALAGFLVHLGGSRKKRSALTARLTRTPDGTVLAVSGRPVGRGTSTANLARMTRVEVWGADRLDPHFLLRGESVGGAHPDAVQVPLRLAHALAADLAPVLSRARVAEDARPLVAAFLAAHPVP